MADYVSIHTGATIDAAISAVPNKVDAEVGKGLSEANFTNAEKAQLAATIPATTEQVDTGTNNTAFVTPLRLQERLSTGFGTAAFVDVGTGINDVPQNSNLGTAAYEDVTTSPTDTTAGRVLQVGAEGVQLGVDVYRRANILGVVSEFGGVPTGAIIERGANANGEYVKYADGTMICWSPVITNGSVNITTLAADGGYRTVGGGLSIWNYPAIFSATPTVQSYSDTTVGNMRGSNLKSTTQFQPFAWALNSGTYSISRVDIAFGRWF